MKQTSVIRITAGICFYFAVLNAVSTFQAWRLPMALFTAACLLAGLLIVRFENPAVRVFLAVLPALCFLAGPYSLLMIVPLLAWLWYFLVMVRGNYAMPLYDYRRIFTVMLAISLFFVAANVANSTLFSNRLISVDSLVYIVLFLFLGVFAMRRMQMGAEMGLNWQVKNLLSVVGIPLAAVGISLVLFLVLRFSSHVLAAVFVPVGRFFIWLLGRIFPTGNRPVEQMSLQEYLTPKAASQVPVEMDTGRMNEALPVEGSSTSPYLVEHAAVIGGWILLGVLLLAVFFLIWKHAGKKHSAEEEELLYEETEAAPADGKRKRRRARIPLLADNARQLRRIYKTYLEYRKGKGLSIHATDTSADILERDRKMGGSDDAEKLRSLYLAARYGDPSAVTREQVHEASACLERIVG